MGPLEEWIMASFRVVPQQGRSMESVERMLAAVDRLVRHTRDIDSFTLEMVAREAHVTQQAAYRYFRDVNDIVRLFVRRVQAVAQEMLIGVLLDESFDSRVTFANAAVSFILDGFRQFSNAPTRLRRRLLHDHFDIPYQSIWILSEIICSTLVHRRDACAGIEAVALSSAIAAVTSVGVSFSLKEHQQIVNGSLRDIMMRIFLAAIENSEAAAT
jgi:AcrR family transcriptional regulator